MAITLPIITEYNDKGAQAAKRSFGKLDEAAKNLAKSFAAAFAVDRIVRFGASAVKAASDLQEAQSKTSVVFGQSASAVETWGQNTAKALGQSRQQALEAAGTFGNLLRAFGETEEQAAIMSTTLVELASDLASFNNVDVTQTLNALRSGLSGETEPLKRFGVALNDVRLKEEALRLGLVKTTKETLPAGIKTQAAYSLILKDTALAQGDFERTSDGLANQTKILTARFEDLKTEIGKNLLPVINDATTELLKMFDVIEERGAGGAALRGVQNLTDSLTDLVVRGLGGPSGGNPWTEYQTNLKNAAAATSRLTNKTGESAGAFRILDRQLADTTRNLQIATSAHDKFMEGYASSRIQNVFSPYFQKLRQKREEQEKLNKAVKDTPTIYNNFALALKDVQGRILDVNKGIAAQIMSAATLGSALATAAANDDNLRSALEERRQAYADLARLDPAKDALELADAWNKVGQAEMNVRDAAAKPRDYVSIFRDQIAKAKEFGATLQKLVKAPYNLGAAGLQQLLDLGPLAGGEVAKELLVTGGRFSVGELNTSLADLSAVTTGVGGPMGGNVYNIRIESVIADKDAVSREVVKALENYEKRFGAIPVTTRGR
jgi:hypothetical protein